MRDWVRRVEPKVNLVLTLKRRVIPPHSGVPRARVDHFGGAFAEFERAMIRERVNAGLARARAQGKTLGRPKVGPAVERRVRASLTKGTGILKTARTLGLGTRTVQRIRQEMDGEETAPS